MKTAYRIAAVFLFQIIAVLVLARVARMSADSLERVGVSVWAAFAYGVPGVLACFGFYRFVFSPSGKERSRISAVLSAAVLAAGCDLVSLVILQRTDVWLTERYIARTQAQLSADSRFSKFRLICYSDDYVLFPYIASGGSVSSEADRKALFQYIRASRPPVYLTPLVWIDGVVTSQNQERRSLNQLVQTTPGTVTSPADAGAAPVPSVSDR